MTAWFRERGWKVSLSGSGRMAKQLLKQVGGLLGTTWIAHRSALELLGELEREAGMSRQAILGRLKRGIKSGGKSFVDPEEIFAGLLKANSLKLGVKVQCSVCMRHNWFELNALDYQLQCRFCLSGFAPPLKSPKEMEWTYRSHGPFAGSTAQGAFTVLLTLRLLSRHPNRGITPLLSYTAERGGKCLEADLSCLYRPSSWRDSEIHIVHVECKSFNRFEPKDINRMKELAAAFPGAVLVFSTLKGELHSSEVRILKSFVVTERKKRLRGKISSSIIVLTSNELLSSSRIGDEWKGKGGLYDELSRQVDLTDFAVLADATQQLYLGLSSWWDWIKQEKLKPVRVR